MDGRTDRRQIKHYSLGLGPKKASCIYGMNENLYAKMRK